MSIQKLNQKQIFFYYFLNFSRYVYVLKFYYTYIHVSAMHIMLFIL